MLLSLGWIFLTAAPSEASAPFVSAQAYAHQLQAVWAEQEGLAGEARENVALARLYDERSSSLARHEARWALRTGSALSAPLPSDRAGLSTWRAALEGNWGAVRRGLSRRAGRRGPASDDVELVLALAAAGQVEEASALARRWAGPGRRLPEGWRPLLDPSGWRAWAAVDSRAGVQEAALEARYRAGDWEEVERAVRAGLLVHPGSAQRIEAAIRWAGAYDEALASELAARWAWLDPDAGDARAEALLAAGWPELARRHASEAVLKLQAELGAGRWARAAAAWRPDMPDVLGLRLARTLVDVGRRAAAEALLAQLDDPEAFVLRARLLSSEPDRLQALLDESAMSPDRWGAWSLVGEAMPSDWSEADRVRAAWSARPPGAPPPALVEAMLRVAPDRADPWTWSALQKGGPALDQARWRSPMHPRVLEAELRWSPKPDRWVEWALRLHSKDERLAAAARMVLGPRAEVGAP